MIVLDWLSNAETTLRQAAIETSRLDSLVLIEDELSKDRAWILAHLEFELSDKHKNVLDQQLALRAEHIPLAYIRQKVEFYGRIFNVSSAVLVPRPESEAMIDMFKELMASAPEFALWRANHVAANGLREQVDLDAVEMIPITVADVGTGSGALGITASLEVPNLAIDLIDIDEVALKVAQSNVVRHATANRVIISDLLAKTSRSYAVLLCNLPYVPDSYPINRAAQHEPSSAIYGGENGLAVYHKLFSQIEELILKPLYILIESLPFQKTELAELASVKGYELLKTDQFIQLFHCR
jgi:release factor glutamine methyltransferase